MAPGVFTGRGKTMNFLVCSLQPDIFSFNLNRNCSNVSERNVKYELGWFATLRSLSLQRHFKSEHVVDYQSKSNKSLFCLKCSVRMFNFSV